MPCKYKRKIGSCCYRNYSDDTLAKAINAIKGVDMSLKDAERLFDIPYRTPWNKLKKKDSGKLEGKLCCRTWKKDT